MTVEETLLLTARAEWEENRCVLPVDTYINLSNAGYLPEVLIENWENEIE